MSRRRTLLAASSGNSDWALELHLTPEWRTQIFTTQSCDIEGAFSEIFEKLNNMLITLGMEEGLYINLSDIPEECNFTIDGERLSSVGRLKDTYALEIIFGDYYCSGTMSAELISLDRDIAADNPF